MAYCLRGGTVYKRHRYDLIEGVCRACGKVKDEKLPADSPVSYSQSPDEGSL